MKYELSQILKDITDRLVSGSLNYKIKENELTGIIREALKDKSKIIGCDTFYSGQERWMTPPSLCIDNYSADIKYNIYDLGFDVDLIVKENHCNVLIENKKIFQSNYSKYDCIFTGNLESSPTWSEAPVFENKNEFFFTYFHEGQIWQDIMRLLNFGSVYDKRFMIGFIFSNKDIEPTMLSQNLRKLVWYLQKQFHHPIFLDGNMRVFSQLENSINNPVDSFMAPKNRHPFWATWCNNNNFKDGVYSGSSRIFSYLFEVHL